jgi:hypothetical protein
MRSMIATRIKPSAFWRRQPSADLFIQDPRQSKLGSFIASVAAMDELIDFRVIAAEVNKACSRADRSPHPTEVMVRWLFIQSRYNLNDEDCEYRALIG